MLDRRDTQSRCRFDTWQCSFAVLAGRRAEDAIAAGSPYSAWNARVRSCLHSHSQLLRPVRSTLRSRSSSSMAARCRARTNRRLPEQPSGRGSDRARSISRASERLDGAGFVQVLRHVVDDAHSISCDHHWDRSPCAGAQFDSGCSCEGGCRLPSLLDHVARPSNANFTRKQQA